MLHCCRPGRRFWCLDCGAAADADCEDAHTVRGLRAALRQQVQQLRVQVPQVAEDVQTQLRALEDLGVKVRIAPELAAGEGMIQLVWV